MAACTRHGCNHRLLNLNPLKQVEKPDYVIQLDWVLNLLADGLPVPGTGEPLETLNIAAMQKTDAQPDCLQLRHKACIKSLW